MNEMRMKFVLFVLMTFNLVISSYSSMGRQLKGVVLDEKGQAVSNASVKNGSSSTFTDEQGVFIFNDDLQGNKVTIAKNGYRDFEGLLGASENDTIFLKFCLSEKVSLLNNKKTKGELSEAVSYLQGDMLSNLPGTNRINTLSGRLPGLLVMQSDGQPGWENGTVSVRGRSTFGTVIGNATILLDGREADVSQLDAYDIESISVLKDAASTAMYGLRSANGIILVNTKRGEKGKVKLSINNQTGVYVASKLPEMLNATSYASLYNEALLNEGLEPAYSDSDFEAFREGSDPVGHPDNNYFGDYFAKTSIQTRNNLSLSGGSDAVLYHVSLGHTSNSGLLITDEAENTYNTNNSMSVINMHANVDIRVNDNLVVSADIKAKKDSRTAPNTYNTSGLVGLIGNALNTPPNAYPIFLKPDSLGGTSDYKNNFYGTLNKSGYSIWERYYLSGGLDFKYDFDFMQGLSLIGSVGYNNYGDHTINRSKNFAVYQNQLNSDGSSTVNKIGDDTNMSNGSSKNNMTRFYYAEVGLAYAKKFGNSNLSSKLIAENRMTETDILRIPHFNRGLKGFVDYSLLSKYLATFSFSLQGSEQFPKSDRYGFFPALSIGWIASNERFLKDSEFLNYLKLRSSAGITGMDFNSFTNSAYFSYIDRFNQGGSYPFGTSLGYNATLFSELADANDLMTWAKSKKLDIGVDAVVLDNKLSMSADYFAERTEDLLVSGTPGILGIDYLYPEGILENKGFEGIISWNETVNRDFEYFLSVNATIAKNKIVDQNEEAREYSWMTRTGHEVGARFGYIADGFFTENDDINSFPDQSTLGEVIPGSLRYRDLNEDNVIDERDQAYLGKGDFPEVWYGFSGGMNFKGIDFNFQFSGFAERTIRYSGSFAYALNNSTSSANEWHLERWQPGDGQNASYPSVSLTKFQNNKATSTFWIEKADFLRLQSVEIGYSLPKQLIQRAGLSKLRIFVTGNNLMTWSKIKRMDPAASADGTDYPVARIFSGGLNLTF